LGIEVFLFRVGELPEAENEFREDIDPPVEKNAFKSLGENQGGFSPLQDSHPLFSKVGTVLLPVGCRAAEIAATLDIA
jgi:hypothetical protein